MVAVLSEEEKVVAVIGEVVLVKVVVLVETEDQGLVIQTMAVVAFVAIV